MKLQYTNRRRRSRIELRRDEKCPLGISLTDNQKDTGRPTIKNIKHGSIAHKSHSLAEGDVILSVNGKDTLNMRKKDLKRLFKDNQLLDIELEYISREASFGKIHFFQRMFLTLKKESGSFGFVVRKDITEYPLISNIKHDGPAYKDGSVMAGDRLLEVDNQSLAFVSLKEVATLLQEKDEAVFLIEYNIGIVSLYQKVVEIEIDCPDTNLGITVNTLADDPSRMYIASIQQGSLTQRCGVFHVGDEIVSIDGIEIKDLTIVKVNDLLTRFRKKPGKLKFIHNRKKSAFASQDSLKRNNSKTESTADLGLEQVPYNETILSNGTYQTISQSSQVSSKRFIRLNINSLYENNFFHKIKSGTAFNDNQLKTLSVLRYINLNLTNMQLILSQEDRKTTQLDLDSSQAEGVIRLRGENSCNVTTANNLSKLMAEYSTMRNLTRELSFHYIQTTAQTELYQSEKCKHSAESQEICSNQLPNTGNLVVELVHNLNEVNAYKFVPETSVKKFIEAVNTINIGCWKCNEKCYSASFAVRKVLLLLSLSDQTSQTTTLISKVLRKVTEIRIPCEECELPHSTFVGSNDMIEQFKFPRHFETFNSSSSSPTVSAEQQAQAFRTQRCETIHEPHVGLDVAHQKAIYRLTDIQGSNNSASVTDSFAQRHSYPLSSNRASFNFPASVSQNGAEQNTMNSSKLFHNDHQEDEQSSRTMTSSWKSTEIIANLREELVEKFPSVILKSTTPKYLAPETTCSNHRFNNANNRCSFGFELAREHPRNSEINVMSKFTAAEIKQGNRKQKHIDTHNVKLIADESNGFGLVLGYDSIAEEGVARIPIITAIRPKSPAARIGLLKTGDRILAMNGRSTVNSSVDDLERLKREIFSLDEMTLNVEFDVSKPIIKCGTFEINMEEYLKPGLVMDDPACPCRVKGLVKGGAAHRSGQVFPGDIILSFGYIKQENLDLQSWTKTKSKTFHLVVRRELGDSQGATSKPPEYICDPVALVRKGTYFHLKRTSVKAVEEHEASNKVILEQEFTLYRDPQTWDFGFLFGEDPRTGRAFITGIRANSPASSSKAIKENDRILEVNGVLIDGSRQNSVMNLIMNASDHITLVTGRILQYR